jgi:hypothetical protein
MSSENPSFKARREREGNKLLSEARGQPRSEMLPESKTTFFVKDVDAQLSFV